jgi:carbonyl reductase 1
LQPPSSGATRHRRVYCNLPRTGRRVIAATYAQHGLLGPRHRRTSASVGTIAAHPAQANKGIGLEIVRQLVLQLPGTQRASEYRVYLGARDADRGRAAVESLPSASAVDVRFRQLDISDAGSIQSCAEWLKKELPEGASASPVHQRSWRAGLDVLIQNAGIATKGSRFDAEVVRGTLATCVRSLTTTELTSRRNYDGTRLLAEALLPLIKPDGRLVNVSSMASSLSKVSDKLAARFRGAKTVDAVSQLMREFQVGSLAPSARPRHG